VDRVNTKNRKIAVVGAGFSGMAGAIQLKRMCPELDVFICEALPRAGKKILVTGNGRCNLTNRNVSAGYYRGDLRLFGSVYPKADNKSMLAFFESLGLVCREDFAGRYYPVSNQASSVLDALRNETDRLGIKVITECRVDSLERRAEGWLLNKSIYVDAVLFACGGKAAPVHGSDGSGLRLLEKNGIRITPLYPSLVPLKVKGFTKALKGIRAQGRISIREAGRVLAEDTGELQYTDYGLSGIPAFQVSGVVTRALGEGRGVIATVDSAPFMTEGELVEYLHNILKRYPDMRAGDILSGIMPKKLGEYFVKECSFNPEKKAVSISAGAVPKIAAAVKNKKYQISSAGDFPEAQVTAGGIVSDEIDLNNLSLRKLKGIFVCGEMTDVDGLCGGYNLQWAFSSAVVAARGIAEELKSASDK